MLKRAFDILLSFVGLIVLSPFFLAIAVLIKLDSRGPVFFRQVRIGRNGKPFQMLKFRTMMHLKHWTGPSLSPKNDPRVTPIGAVLRRFKINEFPQLINVLKGDMSFVGPRPEVPQFVKLYNDEQMRVLSVRPGIVGPSQIRMRNEEELYAEDVDPKRYYVENILPEKLKIDLEYVDSLSVLRDMFYVLHGIWVTMTGAVTKRHLFENVEQIALFVCDIFICAFSYFLAYFLRMEGELPAVEKTILLGTLPYVIVVRMCTFTYFGLYGTLVSYMSSDEVIKIVKGATFSSIIIVLVTFLIGERGHPRSVFAIDWFILQCFLGGYRLLFKAYKDYLGRIRNELQENILIYGAGNLGGLALSYVKMQHGSNVVAFLDDDPKKMRKSFQGVKVLGNRYDIEALVRLYDVSHVLIAMSSVSSNNVEQIKSLCEKASVSYEVFALAN
ncbi:MAG: sugar transferase [Thermodesulfobacteriota bacterium]|nr:sugar transferase [Thermodesulfobacteriota bacterium]